MFELIMKKLDNMEVRQDEIYSIVKSIEHSNNVRKAEIANLTYKVTHVEGTGLTIEKVIEIKEKVIN